MKNVLLGLSVILAASPAFATRARLEALGENKGGSYYISDDRNMFLNPAQLAKYKNKLFLELGGEPGSTAVDRSVLANRAQGGFNGTFGDYTYGLYLNNTTDRALDFVGQLNGLMAASGGTAATNFIGVDSQIEAFIAGEGSLGWGISLLYAGNNDKSATVEKTASVLGTRLGVISGNWQLMATAGLYSSSKNNTGLNDELKGKLSIDAATTYKMNEMTVFGKFTTYGADATNQTLFATTTPAKIRNLGFGAGVGYQHEANKSTTMFARVEADYLNQEITDQPNATLASIAPSVKYWNIPLVLAAESKALEWLTIRGSIGHSLAGQQEGVRGVAGGRNYRNNLAGTTTVAAGVGLTFGDFNIDGLVATNGTQPGVTGYNTIPGFGTGPQSNTTFGLGDGMMSRLAMTYNF